MPHKYMRFLIIKKVKIIEALCHFVSREWAEARLRSRSERTKSILNLCSSQSASDKRACCIRDL